MSTTIAIHRIREGGWIGVIPEQTVEAVSAYDSDTTAAIVGLTGKDAKLGAGRYVARYNDDEHFMCADEGSTIERVFEVEETKINTPVFA